MLKSTALLAPLFALGTAAGFLQNLDDIPLQMGTFPANYDPKAISKRLSALRPDDPVSAWELSGLRQGDIMDPPYGRNVIRNPMRNWPNNTVVYRLQAGIRPEEKLAVRQGMNIITNGTCIKFRPYKMGDKDYVYILYNLTGCYSYVGRQGGAQVLSLQRNNCFQYGLVAHELLHAIGLSHMHEYYNRDEYIYINYTNVNPDDYEQFDTIPEDDYTDFSIPYDYSSIMHYGKYAFTKHNIILPTDGPETYSILPYADVEIGQTRYLSELDYLKVNTKYKCRGYSQVQEEQEGVVGLGPFASEMGGMGKPPGTGESGGSGGSGGYGGLSNIGVGNVGLGVAGVGAGVGAEVGEDKDKGSASVIRPVLSLFRPG